MHRGDAMVVDVTSRLNVPEGTLAAYCRKWRIRRLEVFGLILGDEFGPESDVDILATFDPEARLSLLDLVRAENELSAIVDRPVDLAERDSIETSRNWIRRRSILESARSIYEA